MKIKNVFYRIFANCIFFFAILLENRKLCIFGLLMYAHIEKVKSHFLQTFLKRNFDINTMPKTALPHKFIGEVTYLTIAAPLPKSKRNSR